MLDGREEEGEEEGEGMGEGQGVRAVVDCNHHQPAAMQHMHSMPAGQHPFNSSSAHHYSHLSEPYNRASPSQQHHPHHLPSAIPHAPLLPPIHHFEGSSSSMQSQPPYGPPGMNGAQMPHPPPYNPHHFQYPNGAMQPAPMPSNVGVNGQNGMMRYPIPPQGPMQGMGHSRSSKNKEVKRRTKTGCLTCRKRRIKCDELKPTCRNCAKSKRECMGYDNTFKQQPGPAPIQPAPASATTSSQKSTPTSATLPSNAYPQQHSYPATGGTFVAAGGNVQNQPVDGPFEYAPSLDPALTGAESTLTMAPGGYGSPLQPARSAKYLSIDQLFSLNDVPPQYQDRDAAAPRPLPPQKDLDDYFRYHYAPGLDKMFETNWYSSQGSSHLQRDPNLLDFVAQCMQRMSSPADDQASIDACRSLEARLVWKLATMPRSASQGDQTTAELAPRIDVLEMLLTSQYLSKAKIPPGVDYHSDPASQDRQSFWHHLGRFVSIRDDNSDPAAMHEIQDMLMVLRSMLRVMENRDVLYSLAIARHIGGRLPDFNPPHHPLQPHTDDPNDDVKKLQIAHDFVASEDQKGTTQVIQRLCGMAMRSWMLQKR